MNLQLYIAVSLLAFVIAKEEWKMCYFDLGAMKNQTGQSALSKGASKAKGWMANTQIGNKLGSKVKDVLGPSESIKQYAEIIKQYDLCMVKIQGEYSNTFNLVNSLLNTLNSNGEPNSKQPAQTAHQYSMDSILFSVFYNPEKLGHLEAPYVDYTTELKGFPIGYFTAKTAPFHDTFSIIGVQLDKNTKKTIQTVQKYLQEQWNAPKLAIYIGQMEPVAGNGWECLPKGNGQHDKVCFTGDEMLEATKAVSSSAWKNDDKKSMIGSLKQKVTSSHIGLPEMQITEITIGGPSNSY